MRELLPDLRAEGLELYDRQVRIDAGEDLPRPGLHAIQGPGCLQYDRPRKDVVGLAGRLLVRRRLLQQTQEKHPVVLPAHAAVGGVLHHADALEVARRVRTTEVRAYGVLPGLEEGLHESLVDHRDRGRGSGVVRPEAAAHYHARSDGVEVLRVRPDDDEALWRSGRPWIR